MSGESGQSPWLIVGLGNPGEQYAGNRHNAGAMVVDLLAARIGSRFKTHKARADVVEGRLAGVRVVLAKPRTYMNESGGPVAALTKFYRTPVDRLIVIHDELDVEFGEVRVKQGGGDNGHNGLRSITKSLDDKNYLRVRVGIGRPPGRMDPASFVLRDYSATERRDLGRKRQVAADAVEALLERCINAQLADSNFQPNG